MKKIEGRRRRGRRLKQLHDDLRKLEDLKKIIKS